MEFCLWVPFFSLEGSHRTLDWTLRLNESKHRRSGPRKNTHENWLTLKQSKAKFNQPMGHGMSWELHLGVGGGLPSTWIHQHPTSRYTISQSKLGRSCTVFQIELFHSYIANWSQVSSALMRISVPILHLKCWAMAALGVHHTELPRHSSCELKTCDKKSNWLKSINKE